MAEVLEHRPARLDALALDAVRSARSELTHAPPVTFDTWPVGDAVVILLRYSPQHSRSARSAYLAQLHHAQLTQRIGDTIAGLSGGRLELRGSSYSPHRRLSALAFGTPDGRQSCPRNAAGVV